MLDRKFFVTVLAIFLVSLISLPAYAQSEQVFFTGTVTDWTQACGTSLSGVGSTWTGSATYDSSRTTTDPAIGRTPFDDALNLTINDFGWGDLFENMDIRYSDVLPNMYPELKFRTDTGDLVDMNFEYEYGDNYVFTIGGTNLGNMEWKISQYNGDTDLIFGTVTMSEVPVPGAFWLLGSGLAGIVGLRRRFRKS